jgi:hypothetical protein
MRRIPGFSTNAGATAAIVLLLAVLAGRVVLLSFATPVLQAQSLLESRRPPDEAPARLVLVVDRDDDDKAGRAALRVQKQHPGRDLEVHRISWAAPDGRDSREARIAALVRTYGYSELPVLLTVSREGQVVRVQSFSTTE